MGDTPSHEEGATVPVSQLRYTLRLFKIQHGLPKNAVRVDMLKEPDRVVMEFRKPEVAGRVGMPRVLEASSRQMHEYLSEQVTTV